ncbi:MAG: hypothetical protein DRJ51_05100 [Thermoprotei archaeon]|nr:MAG: hypothetical protein DRJ51_05100 [Thermoprotei archaeon]
MKPIYVNADVLPEAWEKSIKELWREGVTIDTEYNDYSKDAPAMIFVRRPFEEPRIHLKGVVAGSLKGLFEYVDEVLKGTNDWRVGKDWHYTYHERLFSYKVGDTVIDQIKYVIEKLRKAPYSRRAQAITWMPWKDIGVDSPPCLLPHEYIITSKGIRPICEIQEGMEVLTHKGRPRKVVRVFKRRYVGPVITIKPRYLEPITLTPEHPVLAVKSSYCKWYNRICKPTCKAMEKEMKNGTCPQLWKAYRIEWIPASQIRPKDFIVFPIPQFSQTQWQAPFPKDIKSAYLIGLLAADGSLAKGGVKLALSPKQCEHVRTLVEELNLKPIVKEHPNEDMVALYIYSRKLEQWFRQNFYLQPYPRKKGASPKKLPNWVLGLSDKYKKAILMGLIDGDTFTKGVMNNGSYGIGFATTSPVLKTQATLLFLSLGLVPSIVESRLKESFIDGRKMKGDTLYRLVITGQQAIDFACARVSYSRKPTNLFWRDSNYLFIPVHSVRVAYYNGYVYNLEVEEDDSYLTPSMAVHNCTIRLWFRIHEDRLVMHVHMRSLDYREPVLIFRGDEVELVPIGEVYEEGLWKNSSVPSVGEDLKIKWMPVANCIRHELGKNEKIYEVRLLSGRWIRLTKDHALFTYRGGRIVAVPTIELKKGDLVLIPRRIPRPTRALVKLSLNSDVTFDVVKEIREVEPTCDYVYDLSVPPYENFIGGHAGIVVHNSNDALKAAFMNMYAFTELQKSVAESLGVEPGYYLHIADSYHVYGRDWKWVEKFVEQIETGVSKRYWLTTQDFLRMAFR